MSQRPTTSPGDPPAGAPSAAPVAAGRSFARGAAGTLGLRVAALALSVCTAPLISRLLGRDGFGAYENAITWLNVLAMVGALGMDKLLVRSVSVYQTREQWSLLRGIISAANRCVLLAACAITAIAIGLSYLSSARFLAGRLHVDADMLAAFRVSMLMLPVLALTRVRQAAMQGLHRVVIGQLPEFVLQPLLLLAAVAGAFVLMTTRHAWHVVAFQFAAALAAFAVGAIFLGRVTPDEVRRAVPAYEARAWFVAAVPLMFYGAMQMLSAKADTLMLGALAGKSAVGVYGAATRGASLIGLVSIAVSTGVQPVMARLYARHDLAALQKLCSRAALTVTLLSLPIAVGLIVFRYPFLGIFGRAFQTSDGATALVFLCIGYFINVAAGSVAQLLIMTGHERDALVGVAIGAALNLALDAVLIPRYGAIGAAIASAVSMIAWNLLLALRVRQRLGIDATILGILRGSKSEGSG